MVPYGNRDFLLELGHMLQTVGMADSAVECFLKVKGRERAPQACLPHTAGCCLLRSGVGLYPPAVCWPVGRLLAETVIVG